MTSSMADSRAKPEATFRHRGKQEVANRRSDHADETAGAYSPSCQQWQLTLSE